LLYRVLIAVSLIVFYVYYHINGQPLLSYTLATAISVSVIISVLIFYRLELKEYLHFSTAFFALIVGAFLMPFILGLGTVGGFDKTANGAWFGCIISFGLITSFKKPYLNILLSIILLLMLCTGYQTFHRFSYGDLGDRRQLTTAFEHPRLSKIKTHPGRKESFESLLTQIDLSSTSNRSMLAYTNIPMLYYASDHTPITLMPWLVARSEAIFSIVINNLCTSLEATPHLIVQTKVETRSGNWGLNPSGPPIVEDVIKAKSRHERITHAVQRCNPMLVWENDDFRLYETSRNY
jgi:hypothetical protein